MIELKESMMSVSATSYSPLKNQLLATLPSADKESVMSASATSYSPLKNDLLAALPSADYERLLPHLKHVSLTLRDILCEAGDTMKYAYFPLSGMISMLSILVDGVSVEVGVIGHEGMLG